MKLTIREQLNHLADEKYRVFSSSLLPGRENILGVRLPLLQKMASDIAKGDWQGYLAKAEDNTFEEVMLQGLVIGKLKGNIEEILVLVEQFIPKIDCWSICDSFCSGLKITRSHKERVWEFIQPYLESNQEYEVRFGVVMLINYFISSEYAPFAFQHFDRIKLDEYYVKMAVAWAISIYYIQLPEITMEYLKNNDLDDFTYNKALQKITESRQIDQHTKQIIKEMKRK